RGKGADRERMVQQRARETGAAFAMCNLVGGQDELVFDGHSVVVSPGGETLARAHQFTEELVVCDLDLPPSAAAKRPEGDGTGLEGLRTGASARLEARFDVPEAKGAIERRLAD